MPGGECFLTGLEVCTRTSWKISYQGVLFGNEQKSEDFFYLEFILEFKGVKGEGKGDVYCTYTHMSFKLV